MKRLVLPILMLLIGLLCAPLHAQTSASVPTFDPAYKWVDILVGAGLVKTDFPEQRPWSRLEFARLIREAEGRFEEQFETTPKDDSFRQFSNKMAQRQFIKSVLKSLQRRFHDELTDRKPLYVIPLDMARAQYMYLGENPEPIITNWPETINALFHPLVDNMEGRNYFKGHNFDLQTYSYAQLGRYLTLMGRPQVEVTIPATGKSSINIYPKTLAGKVGWKNIELEVGRDQVVWGSTSHGGLLFSDNPRGLDMIMLSNPYPFRFPGVFKKMGEFKFVTFFSNLGPQYQPAKPWMTATQMAWHIRPNIRIGVNHELTFGGSGIAIPAPPSMFLEYLGVATAAGNPDRGGLPTNRGYSGYASFRIPALRNLELHGEIFIEDKNQHLDILLRHDMAYIAALRIPRLDYTGRLSADLEYRLTGSRPYLHGTYASGWALNQNLIASTEGPDSQSVRASLQYSISPDSTVHFLAAYIRRLNNTYISTGSSKMDSITLISSGPVESHVLFSLAGRFCLGERYFLNAKAGLDTVKNYRFFEGNNAHNGLFQVGLEWIR